ncbi:hypothetical protein SPRG_02732 [Saprolegnia parasitica CBS 223.65]|uniref:FYVE-type domain-containing protein n=1 Tax=Saprolegnia parasitica (strain CBS 223.65) TaxID=695850 RepID=A0A067CZP2_SAPPC|nr:hypothetical protein SPRG_02732 [Saprolegnia parasitica CBS 223.65]KDO32252.1 hypothetical protein SPRG_02732 [Saprolegnia parasitica CBS 223.65]|eukprot:XP_012196709.1 hypothetical protein SPRG_02732 [Saprolegnia parasitica CBS 223.65]
MTTESPPPLAEKRGTFEFKYKSGPFSSWALVFAKLEGRWLALYKKEDTNVRSAAIEIGAGVAFKNLADLENFPRRFDLVCSGGILPTLEWSLRFSSKRERDSWVAALSHNITILSRFESGAFPRYHEFEEARDALEAHVPQLKRPLSTKVSKSKPMLHALSFSGEDAMKTLVELGYAATLIEGHRILERLLAKNLIHHILWSHDFSQHELYCFTHNQKTHVVIDAFNSLLETNKFWINFAGGHDRSASSATFASGHTRAQSIRSTHSGDEARATMHSMVSGHSDEQSSVASSVASSFLTREITLLPQAEWTNPDPIKKCERCDKGFSALRRKHHCRVCGGVVCSTCGAYTNLLIGGGMVNVRVCGACRDSPRPTDAKTASFTSTWIPTASSSSSISSCIDCDDLCAPTTITTYPLDFHWDHPWPKAPVCAHEDLRLTALAATGVIHAPAEALFDHLCSMAATASKCAVAVLGFLDADALHIVNEYGLPPTLPRTVPRDVAFAAHAIMSPNPLICRDVATDLRFCRNHTMRDEWGIGFYASCPLVLGSGDIIGVLEVYDAEARGRCACVGDRLDRVAKLIVKRLEEMALTPTQEAIAPAAPAPSTMETKLMELLQQTTGTQQQLQQQQGQMVNTLGSHSKQIDMLTEQLRRIEASLDAKAARKAASDDDTPSS